MEKVFMKVMEWLMAKLQSSYENTRSRVAAMKYLCEVTKTKCRFATTKTKMKIKTKTKNLGEVTKTKNLTGTNRHLRQETMTR